MLRRPQLVRPSTEDGVSWGGKRIILADIASHQIWLIRGHSTYMGRGSGNSYFPTALYCVYDPPRECGRGYPKDRTRLHVGRVTRKVLYDHRHGIKQFFGGHDFVEYIQLDATLMLATYTAKQELRSPKAVRHVIRMASTPIDTSEFRHAGGGVTCDTCGHKYYDHPRHPIDTFLTVTCDGELLKL